MEDADGHAPFIIDDRLALQRHVADDAGVLQCETESHSTLSFHFHIESGLKSAQTPRERILWLSVFSYFRSRFINAREQSASAEKLQLSRIDDPVKSRLEVARQIKAKLAQNE